MSEFRCDDCRQWRDEKTPPYLCAECASKAELVIIRAFVERVEHRAINGAPDYHGALISYRDVLFAELAALESEVKE
jgi:hypothetical protein